MRQIEEYRGIQRNTEVFGGVAGSFNDLRTIHGFAHLDYTKPATNLSERVGSDRFV